ncbi:MAG TPA: O-methyltransferase [Caulobacteraceae bacterium]|nr:O-methyltransferase [Caulobacteraceae bacterium]
MPDAPDLFNVVDAYIDALFAPEDEVLRAALHDARTGGLPPIQVSAAQGKFLYLMAKLVGARRILELGTLGGYSTIWLARALPDDGRLVSLELEPKHAEVAGLNIARAGLSDRVEIVVGPALETLPGVIDGADAPFDLVFMDADKLSYCAYLSMIVNSLRSGALILADNVIRSGRVLEAESADPNARGARDFNAMIAAHPRIEAVILQQVGIKGHDGLAVARVI